MKKILLGILLCALTSKAHGQSINGQASQNVVIPANVIQSDTTKNGYLDCTTGSGGDAYPTTAILTCVRITCQANFPGYFNTGNVFIPLLDTTTPQTMLNKTLDKASQILSQIDKVGLIGLWLVNEGTSTNIIDYSGSNNPCTLLSTAVPWTVDGGRNVATFPGNSATQTEALADCPNVMAPVFVQIVKKNAAVDNAGIEAYLGYSTTAAPSFMMYDYSGNGSISKSSVETLNPAIGASYMAVPVGGYTMQSFSLTNGLAWENSTPNRRTNG